MYHAKAARKSTRDEFKELRKVIEWAEKVIPSFDGEGELERVEKDLDRFLCCCVRVVNERGWVRPVVLLRGIRGRLNGSPWMATKCCETFEDMVSVLVERFSSDLEVEDYKAGGKLGTQLRALGTVWIEPMALVEIAEDPNVCPHVQCCKCKQTGHFTQKCPYDVGEKKSGHEQMEEFIGEISEGINIDKNLNFIEETFERELDGWLVMDWPQKGQPHEEILIKVNFNCEKYTDNSNSVGENKNGQEQMEEVIGEMSEEINDNKNLNFIEGNLERELDKWLVMDWPQKGQAHEETLINVDFNNVKFIDNSNTSEESVGKRELEDFFGTMDTVQGSMELSMGSENQEEANFKDLEGIPMECGQTEGESETQANWKDLIGVQTNYEKTGKMEKCNENTWGSGKPQNKCEIEIEKNRTNTKLEDLDTLQKNHENKERRNTKDFEELLGNSENLVNKYENNGRLWNPEQTLTRYRVSTEENEAGTVGKLSQKAQKNAENEIRKNRIVGEELVENEIVEKEIAEDEIMGEKKVVDEVVGEVIVGNLTGSSKITGNGKSRLYEVKSEEEADKRVMGLRRNGLPWYVRRKRVRLRA